MNTKLYVRKTTAPDNTYFIQPKYSVVNMEVGSTTLLTYCTLMTVRVGWDTEDHYDDWKASKEYSPAGGATGVTYVSGRVVTGMQGILGTLEIDTLNNLVEYHLELLTPSSDS